QPPFSRLDLIVCHHPLATLTFQQQARLLNRFAYALPSCGLLMLVAPATVALPAGCFVCLDPHWGLYRRTQTSVSLSALGCSSSSLPLETFHPAAHAYPCVDNQYLEEL